MNKALLFLLHLVLYGLIIANCVHCKSTVKVASTTIVKDTIKSEKKSLPPTEQISLGASRFSEYLPLIQEKKVALVVNHTSLLDRSHLVDTLLGLGVQVSKVFAPEHGFRGNADAGEHIGHTIDEKTKLPIISLYGKNKKPTYSQLSDLDVLIFDIQDVGARFYTYISTMHYVMEACAENHKKLIVLDRPNPNGSYIDGPVREYKFKSFVGMHPIPIVHGLTIGELALMINGEKWLRNGMTCDLQVIKLDNYRHEMSYKLPIRPSPNLPNDLSVALYPSICLFEGTSISVGRGTEFPFQIIGAPQKSLGDFCFTPQSIVGMAKNPKYQDQTCYGLDFRSKSFPRAFTLRYLIEFYGKYSDKAKFFNGYFDTLVGTSKLREQIEAGLGEKEIKKSWEDDLEKYKELRKKYLLYP